MNLNKQIAIGHVGKDPYIIDTNPDLKIAKFSIAINEKYTKKNGEKIEHTEWINVSAFGKLAGFVETFVKKGSFLYIEGKHKTTEFIKRGDEKPTISCSLNADQILFLNKKSNEEKSPSSLPF